MYLMNGELPALERVIRKIEDETYQAKEMSSQGETNALRMARNPRRVMQSIQTGVLDSNRFIVNMDELLKRIEQPLTEAGEEVKIETKEHYKIYNCLKNMPNCIKSMEITRGDKDGKIGTNRPLENTICVTVHHLDDKSYGGLCVLREWGATDMANIFVGYNPLQTMIWREMINDIPDEQFTACILESRQASDQAPSWAEGIYEVAEEFNKFPENEPLPSEQFDRIFNGTDKEMNPSGKPLTMLNAQRSLCAFNFLRALAKGKQERKQVFVWEDGGYLNPIIDEAIEGKLTIAQFRKLHMVPADPATDDVLSGDFTEYLKTIFIGSVELTRNGYDMSAIIAQRRKMNTRFFSIAASYEKIMLEGDSITLACIDALSQVLYSTGYSLRDRNVLVMGARGNLGRLSVNHLANILKSSKDQLWGCDLKVDWEKPKPGSIPQWAEWSSSDKHLENVGGEVSEYDELDEQVRYSLDVIFGWTGGAKTVNKNGRKIYYHTITGQNIADWMTIGDQKSQLYLVSGSTKTVEFADVLVWLESLLSTPEDQRTINDYRLIKLIAQHIPDQLSIAAVQQVLPDIKPEQVKRNFGTQFTFVFMKNDVEVTKTLYLVNNTMPVNFMYYGTPTEIMDMTYSQVTSCAVALMKHKDGEPGIYPTDYRREATKDVYLARILDKDYDVPTVTIPVSDKEVFQGAVVAYTAYFSYVNKLIETFGEKETLTLMTDSDTARGRKVGASIKKEAGGKDFSIPEALDTIVEMASGIGGVDTVLMRTNYCGRTVTAFGKCPVYEAGKAVGWDDKKISAICRASSLAFLDSVVEQLNPGLVYLVTAFRSERDHGCVEQIVQKLRE